MSKQYEISHISDFLKLPEDKMIKCLDELKENLAGIKAVVETSNLMAEISGVEQPPMSEIFPKFTWVDDGEDKVTIAVKVAEEPS